MINLYQVAECDVYIRAELFFSRIRPITQEVPMLGEVPARVTGRLTKEGLPVFIFQRAWDYWRVQGFVPLEVALEIYNDPSRLGRRDVSVIGDDSYPSPEKWAKPNYRELQRQGLYTVGMTTEDCERVAREHNIAWGIDYYHIDSLDALVLFVSILKSHGLAD